MTDPTYLLLSLTNEGRVSLRRLRKCGELTYRVEPPNEGNSNMEPYCGSTWRTAGYSIDVVRLPEEKR